jgi:hypothetical protein
MEWPKERLFQTPPSEMKTHEISATNAENTPCKRAKTMGAWRTSIANTSQFVS